MPQDRNFPSTARLLELDDAVEALLLRGHRGSLESIGAGEMTCVLAWDGFACKRLPPLADRTRLDRHGALILEYVDRLKATGIEVIETAVQIIDRSGYAVGYVVQPQLTPATLLPAFMATQAPSEALALAAKVFDAVERATGSGIGIDANLSNWAVKDGRPLYLDVSTPMLRDAAGHHRLDSDLFVSTMPRLLQGLVRRFFVNDLLDRYYLPRSVFENLLGDLPNCGLENLTMPLLEDVNRRLSTPLTTAHIDAYRREDRLTWGLIRWSLRLERRWRRWNPDGHPPHLIPSYFRDANR
jgi:hypothetical protein